MTDTPFAQLSWSLYGDPYRHVWLGGNFSRLGTYRAGDEQRYAYTRNFPAYWHYVTSWDGFYMRYIDGDWMLDDPIPAEDLPPVLRYWLDKRAVPAGDLGSLSYRLAKVYSLPSLAPDNLWRAEVHLAGLTERLPHNANTPTSSALEELQAWTGARSRRKAAR